MGWKYFLPRSFTPNITCRCNICTDNRPWPIMLLSISIWNLTQGNYAVSVIWHTLELPSQQLMICGKQIKYWLSKKKKKKLILVSWQLWHIILLDVNKGNLEYIGNLDSFQFSEITWYINQATIFEAKSTSSSVDLRNNISVWNFISRGV